MTQQEAIEIALKWMGPAGTGPDDEPCDCPICVEIRAAREVLESG